MARRLDEKSRVAVCGHVDPALDLEDLCVHLEGALVWIGRRSWAGTENIRKSSRCR